jgi:hypothetical protein
MPFPIYRKEGGGEGGELQSLLAGCAVKRLSGGVSSSSTVLSVAAAVHLVKEGGGGGGGGLKLPTVYIM